MATNCPLLLLTVSFTGLSSAPSFLTSVVTDFRSPRCTPTRGSLSEGLFRRSGDCVQLFDLVLVGVSFGIALSLRPSRSLRPTGDRDPGSANSPWSLVRISVSSIPTRILVRVNLRSDAALPLTRSSSSFMLRAVTVIFSCICGEGPLISASSAARCCLTRWVLRLLLNLCGVKNSFCSDDARFMRYLKCTELQLLLCALPMD